MEFLNNATYSIYNSFLSNTLVYIEFQNWIYVVVFMALVCFMIIATQKSKLYNIRFSLNYIAKSYKINKFGLIWKPYFKKDGYFGFYIENALWK